MKLLMRVLLPVVALALVLGHTSRHALAQAPTPTPRPATITIEFSCPDVPWSCLNTRTATKWQMYETFCNQNDVCRFKHVQQVNSGDRFTLKSLAQWRLYMGPQDDSNNRIMDCSPYLNQIAGSTVLEVFGACTRNPELCAGPKHWQVYSCTERPDGSCPWVYAGEYNKDCQYIEMEATTGYHAKLHWGLPGELIPTVTPTATRTQAATRTATPTRTSTPTRTVAPTRTPTREVTSPPTAIPTATGTTKPTATKAPVYRLGLPVLFRQ